MKALAALLLLAGCSTAVRPTFAPPPFTEEDPPYQLRLVWDYPSNDLASVYFVIHHSPALDPGWDQWPVFAVVSNATEYPFTPDRYDFFWCEAIDRVSGLSSGPNQ